MTYLLKQNKKGPLSQINFKEWVVILTTIFLIAIFSISKSARSSVSDLFSPFFGAGNYFYNSVNKIHSVFTDKTVLINENTKLSDEIENNILSISDYESIKYENSKLREELGMRPIGENLAANIVARAPQIPLDSIFINSGTKKGVHEGDLVLVGERNLVGKVAEVSQNRATVILNTFASIKTYGFVSRTNESIELDGAGSSIEAKVPIDFDIEIGDKIMVNGSSIYLAAVVGSVDEDKASGFKKVLLSLPVDMTKVNMVFVESLVDQN